MGNIEWKVVVELTREIAWPAVVGVIVFVLRRPIVEILSHLVRRANKVSLYKVSVELSTLPELSTNWSVGSVDPRQLTSAQIFDSGSESLMNDLFRADDAEYIIVDLRKGESWLTSRLFVFSLFLGELRGLRAFVFLENAQGVRRRFVGIASPTSIRRALGKQYPWLEEAWSRVISQEFGDAPAEQEGNSTFSARGYPLARGAENWRVGILINSLIGRLQRNTKPPENEIRSYLKLEPESNVWERTKWIDGDRLERDLVDVLETVWCEDYPDRPRDLLADAVARRKGEFVALVDEDRRFNGLVDRYALLEQLWNRRENAGNATEGTAR